MKIERDFDYEATDELFENIDIDHLIDRLEGQDGGLRVSKPRAEGDSGLTQYVWRKAAFHAGVNDSMPVMAHSWLQTYLDDRGIDAKVSGLTNDAGEEIQDALQDVVDAVLIELGEDPSRAARRWKQAGAF